MKPLPWTKLKRPLGYAAFAAVAFVLGLIWTFPYETLRQRISLEAQSAGYNVRLGALGPGFFSVKAQNVQVSKLDGADGKPSEPLRLDAVSLRPSLFPLGVAVNADALGGHIHGVVGGLTETAVRLSLADLNLAKGNLKGFSGLDLEGTVNGEVSLDIPNDRQQPNFAQTSGQLALTADNLTLRGGTVTVPLYGQMTPLDLPRVKLGTLESAIRFDKGAGTVEKFAGRGGDLELLVSGTLKLARVLPYSEGNLQVKLKPQPELMKNGFIGMGISALPADPSNPGFRSARMTGFLGSPNFVPGV